jgi:hypothetical protein
MKTWRDAEICLFHSARDATPAQTVTISTVLRAIQSSTYRPAIERLRHLRATRGESAYTAAKARLDAVTFGGTFAPTRAKAHLVQHSGIIHGDVDHLPDVPAVKQALCADPYTTYCFVSPSAEGLKLGVPVTPVPDDAAYRHAWQAVADYYQQHYGVTWDPSGKESCRLCFVSWDPHLYINTAADPFPVPPLPTAAASPALSLSARRAVARDRRDYYAWQALETATRMLDGSRLGTRHFWRRKAAYLLGGYVAGGILSYDEAHTALEVAVARNSAHPQRSMRTINACLHAGMRAAISLEQLAQERRAWRAAHWHTRAHPWTGSLSTIAAEEIPPWR